MIIKSAQFEKGYVLGDTSYDVSIPQIVFYGRSNTGKSSTLNALLGRGIAKASSTPGKTKEINFFSVNNSFYVVDLPGYGYAKVSRVERAKLRELIEWFIIDSPADTRKSILILDAQVGCTDLDREILHLLISKDESIIILLNKADKLTQSELSKVLKATYAEVPEGTPVIVFSAKTKKGVDKVWQSIEAE
jgi:GTP-binding protein